MVDQLAPRAATVDFRSPLGRTATLARPGSLVGTVLTELDAMDWDNAAVRDGPAPGAVRRLRRVRVRDGGAWTVTLRRDRVRGAISAQMLATWWCFLLAGRGSLCQRCGHGSGVESARFPHRGHRF